MELPSSPPQGKEGARAGVSEARCPLLSPRRWPTLSFRASARRPRDDGARTGKGLTQGTSSRRPLALTSLTQAGSGPGEEAVPRPDRVSLKGSASPTAQRATLRLAPRALVPWSRGAHPARDSPTCHGLCSGRAVPGTSRLLRPPRWPRLALTCPAQQASCAQQEGPQQRGREHAGRPGHDSGRLALRGRDGGLCLQRPPRGRETHRAPRPGPRSPARPPAAGGTALPPRPPPLPASHRYYPRLPGGLEASLSPPSWASLPFSKSKGRWLRPAPPSRAVQVSL